VIAEERETVINATDADDMVRIWTCQARYLGRLRRHPSFTEVKSGRYGSTEWAEFTIPASEWNPASGAKRRVTLTDEQKRAAAAHLPKRRSLLPKMPPQEAGQRNELPETLSVSVDGDRAANPLLTGGNGEAVQAAHG
jgi:hypothetical protein